MNTYLPTWPLPPDKPTPPRKGWGGIAIVCAALLVGACGFGSLSAEDKAFFKATSSEIGSKGVVLFELRRRATDDIIELCLKEEGDATSKTACVKGAIEIVD